MMELLNDRTEKLNMLTKRDLERQLNIQKRKDDKDQISADNEKLDYFESIFTEKLSIIKNSINVSAEIPKDELPNHFNCIYKDILTLQKYVAASNIFLRNYDLKRCQENLQALSTEAKTLEEQLLPKKKFGFRNKTKPKTQELTTNGLLKVDEVDSSCCSTSVDLLLKENFCGFFSKTGENLTLTAEDTFKKDVSLEKLANCKVELYGSPSTLHLNNLRNCRIFSGPVSTSIFAEDCQNCVLVIACQQLRLHSSQHVQIYLHVTSRAIMEDCSNIFVAPYNWCYKEIEDDFERATLDKTVNNWKCIDDFNWLNTDKHSPNWKEILEEDRVENWNN